MNNVSVSANGSGSSVGGFIGVASASSTSGAILDISQCGNRGNLKIKATYGYSSTACGGLVGTLAHNVTSIVECFNEGKVDGTAYYSYVGGLVGDLKLNETVNFSLFDSYVNASIVASCTNGTSQAGGLIGHTTGDNFEVSHIRNCYATGGLNASNRAGISCWHENENETTIENCYFDMTRFGLKKNEVACQLGAFHTKWFTEKVMDSYGMTTVEMKKADNYVEWDGQNVWGITDSLNDGYPHLQWYYGNEHAWESETMEEQVSPIVEAVKKYTSDVTLMKVEKIVESTASDDVKYKMLTEIFNEYGINDPLEGIEYLKETVDERYAFVGLTTNELYASYNFLDYLNNTPKGQIARSLLYTDALIFNWEVGKWLDVTTYFEGDYPGIDKYKDLLLCVMQYEGMEDEVFQYSEEAFKILDNLHKTYTVATDDEWNALKIKLRNAKTSEESQEIVFNIIDNYIIPKVGSDKITLKSKNLGDALDITGDVFSVWEATSDTIFDFINVSTQLKLYEEYKMFLLDIVNSGDQLPWEMQVAAAALLEELDTGYYQVIRRGLYSACDATGEVIEIDKKLFSKVVTEALDTIQLGAWMVNCVVDMGTFEKNATQVQGFGYLSLFYTTKLYEYATEFRGNPSEENAWKFYYAYNMLYRVRLLGEETYIKMCEMKGLFGALVQYGYHVDEKEAMVRKTIEMMERDFKFQLDKQIEIPEDYKFLQKIIVACPVDVQIFDTDGNLICIMKDGIESEIENEYGKFVTYKSASNNEYVKVAYLLKNDNYQIQIIGNEQGRVDYTLSKKDNDGVCHVYCLSNCPIMKNGIVQMNTGGSNILQVLIDEDGDAVFENTKELEAKQQDTYVNVKNIQSETNDILMKVGEKKTLDIQVMPLNASNKKLCWYSDNEQVALANNNIIEALAPGTANIMICPLDNRDVSIVCRVEVIDNNDINSDVGEVEEEENPSVNDEYENKPANEPEIPSVGDEADDSTRDNESITYFKNGGKHSNENSAAEKLNAPKTGDNTFAMELGIICVFSVTVIITVCLCIKKDIKRPRKRKRGNR